MATIQHVFKRGSVYWWRRRLPIGTDPRVWVRVELSLNTKELELARLIASEVTLANHRLLPSLKSKMISAEDAKRILIQVALEHSSHLDTMMLLRHGDGRTPEDARRSEVSTAWALRLYAAQGQKAAIGSAEERELRSAGLDEEMIKDVARIVRFYQTTGFVNPSKQKLRRILQQHQVPPVDLHLRQAEALYMRGMSAALLNTERRWSGARSDDLALVQAAMANSILPQPDANWVQEKRPPDYSSLGQGSPVCEVEEPLTAVEQESYKLDAEDQEEDEPDEEDELSEQTLGLVDIVARAAVEKVKTGDWAEKQDRQHISIAKLFVRFVGHDQPRRMRQAHISQFRSLLFNLPKNHGKSPKDHLLPLSALVARAETLPPEEVGLSTATINRYMTQIGNIVSICKHAGYPFGNFEGVEGLRTKKKGNARNDRPPFKTDELRTLFALPVWNGSASLAERLMAGNVTFHDATYWIPLLSVYNGARREENCGLMVSEIEVDGDVDLPCFRFEDSPVRKLKNPQSTRRVPIHPELIRLGFLTYVGALREAGHKLLFPELRAACADTTMGDVFDDAWQKVRAAALPEAKEQGKVLHSIRHWFNNEMKQAGVHSEIRRDILGHSNGDVNEGRYTDSARLLVMANAMSTLPVPTARLLPHRIKLTDQVVAHTARLGRKARKAT